MSITVSNSMMSIHPGGGTVAQDTFHQSMANHFSPRPADGSTLQQAVSIHMPWQAC